MPKLLLVVPSARPKNRAAVTVALVPMPHPQLSPRRIWALVAATSAAAFLFVANESATVGLIRRIAADLGRPEAQIGLLATVFSAVVMLASIPLAISAKKLPRRTLMIIALGVWVIGVTITAAATSLPTLIAGRALSAMAHALFWAIAQPTLAALFPRHTRGKLVSVFMLGPTLYGIIGGPVITWIGLATSWRIPFFAMAALGAVILAIMLPNLPRNSASTGGAASATHPHFGRYLRVLIAVFLVAGANGIYAPFSVAVLIDLIGFQENNLPLVFLIGGTAGLLGNYLAGRFVDEYQGITVLTAICLIVSGWLTMALAPYGKLLGVIGLVLQASGWTAFVTSMISRVLRYTTLPTDIGNAVYTTSFNLGAMLGTLLGAAILAHAGPHLIPIVSAGACALAGLVLLTQFWRAPKPLITPRKPLTSEHTACLT